MVTQAKFVCKRFKEVVMPSNSVFSQILNKTFDIVDEITDSADDAMDRLDSRMVV